MTAEANAKPTKSSKKPTRSYRKHGLTKLVRTTLTTKLDSRTIYGRLVNATRTDLLSSLAGKDNLSTQELIILEMAARGWAKYLAIDADLKSRGFINRRKRCLTPLAKDQTSIAEGVSKNLDRLGLKRRAKPVPTLAEYLASKAQTTKPEGAA